MPVNGLFGPDSVTWRVNRESVLLLGGARALLMQLAHPALAAAVDQHSAYREDPWSRLFHTLDVSAEIVFGDRDTADRAAERLRNLHRQVRGTVADGDAAGSPYAANDPELLRWVWATLVDSALLTYTRYVGPLKLADVEGYYEEQKRFLAACGAPAEAAPPTYANLNAYIDVTIDDVLEVTSPARAIAEQILRPRGPLPLRPLYDALNLTTIGLLPPSVREGYGLGWGSQRERLLGASTSAIRRLMPLLPSLLRELPTARSAHRRLREAA